MTMQPMAMYGLEVPCGDVAISAKPDIPSAFRITMAAIDPSAEPEGEEGLPPRATLKVIRQSLLADEDDESDDGFDQAEMERILREEASDESSDEDDADGMNGGPSDPTKGKMARRAAKEKEIKALLASEGMDVDSEDLDDEQPNGINGAVKSAKAMGKLPASDSDEDEDDDDLDDDEGEEFEEFVICTLDPTKLYQQPLDITFGEDEHVWFKVSGTHSIFLTGNYVDFASDESMYDPDSDEDEEYDLEPDMDEIDDEDMDEIDELDGMEDPRVTELDEEEDEAPALIKASKNSTKTNKNKRPAPESADEDEAEAGAQGLDEMIADARAVQASVSGEQQQKLSKKERKALKKLKNNDGSAAPAPSAPVKTDEKKETEAPSSTKSDKKVSFAKELEQGPTPTKAPEKSTPAADDSKSKSSASTGVKTVQGVTVDDRKIGTGQAAKNGDRVSMRYIGKLKDGKVFDNNKKGKPFSFKLGSGDVIRGWDIGVAGMQVGGERRITVPAHLAYGNKRTGEIPPNSSLTFDLKVLNIEKK